MTISTQTYLGATSGSAGVAGQVNQFLVGHSANYLYQGTVQSSQTTAGTGTVDSSTAWYAQSFTTGSAQTSIGLALLSMKTVGTSALPLQVMLFADLGGLPTGPPLLTLTASFEYVGFAPAFVTFPFPVSVSPATKYHIGIQQVGSSADHYTWSLSNQTSGAASSPDGTTWTSQAYGLMYEIYDQTVTGLLQCIYSDSGKRWSWQAYNSLNMITELCEFTQAQTSASYVQSNRTFSYSNGLMSGVA